MTTYDYVKNISPDLTWILENIAISAMSNKNVDYLTWSEETKICKVVWKTTLNSSDKAILDDIVARAPDLVE